MQTLYAAMSGLESLDPGFLGFCSTLPIGFISHLSRYQVDGRLSGYTQTVYN